jgi:hypothetical protein
VWDDLHREIRTGQRRYVGTDRGERYATAIAFHGEGEYADPRTHERTLGDLLHPARPGRTVSVVNAAAREVATDPAAWTLDRLLDLYATLEAEARERRAET